MAKYPEGDTKFTAQVKLLQKRIYGSSPLKDSILEQAVDFYEQELASQFALEEVNNKLSASKQAETRKQVSIHQLEQQQKALTADLEEARLLRYQNLYQVCIDIIALAESTSFSDTQRNSAQLLGNIQLLLPTEGKKVAPANEKSKPLYRAILALRLLDNICINNKLSNTYIASFLPNISGEAYKQLQKMDEAQYQRFVDNVKVPLLMAALLLDIGNYHPDAQRIMHGENGESDYFRTLEVAERKALLQINYKQTIRYITHGIGLGRYIGSCKQERDEFIREESQRHNFIKQLLKATVQPKSGLGNLLKVPQIYTSIVLSTKTSYNYKLLPKVYQAMYQNAERGIISKDIVDALYQITGSFPQGYGITFIPSDIDDKVRYEYAIVTQFYPENPDEPICRTATRYLTFLGHGRDLVVKQSHNLYFVETAKNFSRLSKERLNEILELLASNYQERKKLDLLPRCWQPSEYFSLKRHQKLWNRHR